MAQDFLFDLLRPERLTAIVDIGSNPIDPPPYKAMFAAGLCTLTGFEPQHDRLAELQRAARPNETYLRDAVGDGEEHTLHINKRSGLTSLLEFNTDILMQINFARDMGIIAKRERISTKRLDDIDLPALDMLKIDIQGGELAVFRGGQRRLSEAVAIQTEISFLPMYRDQPLFGDVDQALRPLGFLPHCFADIARWPIASTTTGGGPHQSSGRQIVEADIVYVRDFTRRENMSSEQWKHLAMIAHHCYGSVDLVVRCLWMLGIDPRGYIEALRRQAAKQASRS